MDRLTPDTRIQDVLDLGEPMVEAFRRLGLKCPDCPAAAVETLRLAALYHGRDPQQVLDGLAESLRKMNRPADGK